MLTQQRTAGVRILRQAVRWQDLQPTPDTYSPERLDRFILAAAAHARPPSPGSV